MGAPVAYDPAEMRAAQAEAARLRAACDMLKGAPKSSRDDPNFVESFFSASRLHFIGALVAGAAWFGIERALRRESNLFWLRVSGD